MNELGPGQLWIFGYGSLMWRPDFPSLRRQTGYIDGWGRRFYQGSTDHRGTPATPGRVVTLVAGPQERCWGVAYLVPESDAAAVLARLDEREKGGYRRQVAPMHGSGPEAESIADVLFYLAGPENPNYLGPDEPHAMAQQIRHAVGPSGANRDYLFQLNRTLHDMGVAEPHCLQLEALVRAI